MTRDEIERFFERRRDAWLRHDAEALTRDYTDDAVVDSPMGGGDVRGRAAIEALYSAFLASFPDVTMEAQERIVEGDHVVQLATFCGTNSGGFMGLPPTGKRFNFSAVVVFTFRNSQVVHEKRVYDFTRFLIEVGVLKAKPV